MYCYGFYIHRFVCYFILYLYLVVWLILWCGCVIDCRWMSLALVDVLTTVRLDYCPQKFCQLYLTALSMLIEDNNIL